jgi:DMSO/TMAO reductase YedYZ molybdopterin-dependent catalytic subunit
MSTVPAPPNDPVVQMRRKTRGALLWSAVFVLGVSGAIWAIMNGPKKAGAPTILRTGLEATDKITSSLGATSTTKAETYPRSATEKPRVNGLYGLDGDVDINTWALHVFDGSNKVSPLKLAAFDDLPKTEVIAKFKCIEGWSQVVQAKGVKFSDFLGKYAAQLGINLGHTGPVKPEDLSKLPEWVGLKTPDGEYYVGIDMKSMLNPQTILCWEMDSKPLPMDQGFPLRLVIPCKYGIKNIKRIGTIELTNKRPPDFWYERGYDYYAGL